ncbi:hypothetical protein C7212DRAFT_342280 [Tuber magnatum]|uniref:DJ-1/PfpI domain-containing protein n=1 Tax=Tuber magnatum TaxID=42249 RepID=A0A317SSG0_9PEZI|nr:hypothetical protein C7212DRAFT_342280 [Tuber magnatum]
MAAASVNPAACADEKTIPTTFGVLLFPGFQALDVFGPIDVLNTLALSKKLTLYIIAETLDPVTTKIPTVNATGSEFSELAMTLEYERHTDPDWDPFAEYWGATWPLTPRAGGRSD